MFYLWPVKIWQDLPSNTSNLYCFNTVLHQGSLKGRGTTGKSDLLIPLSSNATSFVRWRISLFSDASLHLSTDSNKSPHYYINITYTTKTGFTLFHSPLYNTKDKFCNSCIKQLWTAQHNFHTNVELWVSQMPYHLPYTPNREKYHKLCNVCILILPVVGLASLPHSGFSMSCWIFNCCGYSYSNIVHTHIQLSSSTSILTYKCSFNPILIYTNSWELQLTY